MSNQSEKQERFLVYIGGAWLLEPYDGKVGAVKALNSKTMRYQVVDKEAKTWVEKDPASDIRYNVYSDKDLHSIAEDKGLIM